jgi:competence ComEA-like helix-hairpin-helix protein
MKKHQKSFFYYSQGEKRALIVLACLIAVSGILVALVNNPSPAFESSGEEAPPPQYIVNPDNAPQPPPLSEAPSSPKQSPPPHNPGYSSSARAPKQEKSYQKAEKFPPGTIVELNTADTTTLKKIPGIGTFFANAIVKLRDNFGGFHSINQLKEIKQMDDEKFNSLKSWLAVDTTFIVPIPVNKAQWRNIANHPYINKSQASIICRLRDKKPLQSWDSLVLLEEFTPSDIERLRPYISFE